MKPAESLAVNLGGVGIERAARLGEDGVPALCLAGEALVRYPLRLPAQSDGTVAGIARRAIELLIALAGVLILAIALPVIALAIRLDSPGPVLFRQRRVGSDGRRFTMFKLRTMQRDAEVRRDHVLDLNVMGRVTFKAVGDPRITRVGRLLRRFSLDEAPQFWNVLRGEMALVGPRPPLPGEVEGYGDHERRRLDVKPGITGLWQVSGRSTRPHDEMVALDLEYVERRSLRLDLAIILATIPAMLGGNGAY
ncbi:MAG: sugar transferase [Chloroflexi bacterium]|nr:MAG: sugar transferase [Chloroflexota bacterium]